MDNINTTEPTGHHILIIDVVGSSFGSFKTSVASKIPLDLTTGRLVEFGEVITPNDQNTLKRFYKVTSGDYTSETYARTFLEFEKMMINKRNGVISQINQLVQPLRTKGSDMKEVWANMFMLDAGPYASRGYLENAFSSIKERHASTHHWACVHYKHLEPSCSAMSIVSLCKYLELISGLRVKYLVVFIDLPAERCVENIVKRDRVSEKDFDPTYVHNLCNASVRCVKEDM